VTYQRVGDPVEITLTALRGRWTPQVIGELLGGERAFSEIRAALPALSDKVLCERLAHLTSTGVLDRTRTPGWPPRVTYTLTARGRRLAPVLRALRDWGTH
jgi:DNA-binding HxlR family transcriptional regulator